MMNAMSQGNDGSLTTIHADSPRGVFNRIAVYAMQSADAMRWDTAHALIAGSLDFVVFIRRERSGAEPGHRRVVTDVLEVSGWDSTGVQASAIFDRQPDGAVVRRHGVPVGRWQELTAAGWAEEPEDAVWSQFRGVGRW